MSGRKGRDFWLATVAYVTAACLAYIQVLLNGQFLCDDFILLARIRLGLGIWDYKGADFYRPVISTTLSALWRLFGNDPLPYYVFNLSMLVSAGLMLRSIWLQLDPRPREAGSERTALAAGLIFVLWITHTESISWIAGMTDSVAVLLGTLALWAFIRYCKQPAFGIFVASALFLWLGLITKEAIVLWIPILLLFGWTLIPSARGWKLRGAEAVALFAEGGVYVLWRKHVLGTLIGGYGAGVHLNSSWHGITTKLMRHFANAFLPFNKPIALVFGEIWVADLTTIFSVGMLTFIIRKWPRTKPLPDWIQKALGLLALIGTLRLLVELAPTFVDSDFHLQAMAVEVILFTLAVYLYFRYKIKFEFASRPAFAYVSALCYLLHTHSMDGGEELLLLVGYIWFAFATRPLAERTSEEIRLVKLGLVSFASTVLAIIPTATLRVNLSGEASRFSYGPSFFASLAFACIGLLYVRKTSVRFALATPAFALALILLYESNVPWALASKLSGETTRLVGKILPARRIYVLSVPGTLTGSIFLRIGIEHIAEVAQNDDKVKIQTATYGIGCIDGDSIRVQPLPDHAYMLSVEQNNHERRFADLHLLSGEPRMVDGWFSFPAEKVGNAPGFVVHLDGFIPSKDRVIVVDGQSARLIL